MSVITTLAGLVADSQVLKHLNGTGVTSPLATLANKLKLGDVFTNIGARLDALEAETGDGGALTVDTISEETAGAGVTIDGALVKDGLLQNNQIGIAVLAAAGGTGGATAGTFSVQVNKPDEATAFGKAVQLYVQVDDTQYTNDPNGNVTFASATTGTIVATGAGWALIETSAAGAFACALANAADETVYFSACTPKHGMSDPTDHALIVSNSVSATWAA